MTITTNILFLPLDVFGLSVQLLVAPQGSDEATATWEGYKKAGPLLISTDHRGTADGGPFHEFFSDVAVKLTGSDTWINAQ
jgi:hypothetical protein